MGWENGMGKGEDCNHCRLATLMPIPRNNSCKNTCQAMVGITKK